MFILAEIQIVIFLSSKLKVFMVSVGVLPSINTLVSSAKRTGINISNDVDISLKGLATPTVPVLGRETRIGHMDQS